MSLSDKNIRRGKCDLCGKWFDDDGTCDYNVLLESIDGKYYEELKLKICPCCEEKIDELYGKRV